MATTLDDLASRVVTKPAVAVDASIPTRTDRGIKGTLIDDYAIEIGMKIATLATILILGSIGYLALERAIGVKTITMIRVWLPVLGWAFLAFFHKPFLRFGWWGLLATLTVIPTTSGYLWQLFQGMVGAR
jgi:hypothetical protein